MDISEKDRGKLIKIIKKNITYLGHIVNISGNELTIKLKDNGYNISVILDKDTKYELLSEKKEIGKTYKLEIKQNPALPSICLVATGGTIGLRGGDRFVCHGGVRGRGDELPVA